MTKSKQLRLERVRATPWFSIEPVGSGSKGFLRFALQEAKNAKQWLWEILDVKGELPEGNLEWHAKQFRRRYLTGKPTLHSVPGYVFERAMLDALKTWEDIDREEGLTWNSVFLPLRDGWTGDRSGVEEVVQKFSFSGEPKQVARRPSVDSRAVTPEKAEEEWFEEGVLAWKWGKVKTGVNVEAAMQTCLKAKRIPWRGRERFFDLVEEIEVAKVKNRDMGKFEQWKMRLILRR